MRGAPAAGPRRALQDLLEAAPQVVRLAHGFVLGGLFHEAAGSSRLVLELVRFGLTGFRGDVLLGRDLGGTTGSGSVGQLDADRCRCS